MYRLLIADDEGIMLESFTEIIRKQFGDRITGQERTGSN